MTDTRTRHNEAVDALLDQLAAQKKMTGILETALLRCAGRGCEHDAPLEDLRNLHLPRVDGYCPEDGQVFPCRTARMLLRVT